MTFYATVVLPHGMNSKGVKYQFNIFTRYCKQLCGETSVPHWKDAGNLWSSL